MNDDNKNSFLDGNTLLAIVLSFGIFIVWQLYMNETYPPEDVTKTSTESPSGGALGEKSASAVAETQSEAGTTTSPGLPTTPPQVSALKEETIAIAGENVNLKLSNLGMGLGEIVLNGYTDRNQKNIHFSPSEKGLTSAIAQIASEEDEPKAAQPLSAEILNVLKYKNFATLVGSQPVAFEIETATETSYLGKGQLAEGEITKKIDVDDKSYSANVEILVKWSGSVRPPIETIFYDRIKAEKSSFFRPSYEGTDIFNLTEGNEERTRQMLEEEYSENYKDVTLSAIASQYFTVALNDESELMPKTSSILYTDQGIGIAKTVVQHPSSAVKDQTLIKYKIFFGPKDRDLLLSINEQMPAIIDYGFFGFIALPILNLLKFLYSFIGNWGFSIIVLTFIIRLLLLPIAISSMRSMKKMQKIQPLLKQLKERYKDDPQKMNLETMALMKKEGANPLGGCLPMFAQIPVFFALYSVLGVSIELYKAPFLLWIKDLSFQDPFYLLPVLTSVLFFLQTKMTPSTMDPNQKKVMMFMPLFFGVIMMSMPAGLMVYFLTNNLFGIGQQVYINREKTA